MKNLAFLSLTQMKEDYTTNSYYITYTLGSERVKVSKSFDGFVNSKPQKCYGASFEDENFNTEAGPLDVMHWVETDVTGVGAQIVSHHRILVSVPCEFLCEKESDQMVFRYIHKSLLSSGWKKTSSTLSYLP